MRQTAGSENAPGPAAADEGGRLAAVLRSHGALGVVVAIAILLLGSLGGLPVLLWARLSRTPWRALGFVRPRSWRVTVAAGVAMGAVFKLVMKAVVMPLLGGAEINAAYHFLAGNPAALPGMVLSIVFLAGFGEETVFRGFLFERVGALVGRGRFARLATVLLSAALFALAHLPDQGRDGAVQAAVTGLVFGGIFAATGELALVMVAHVAFDLVAIAIIYLGLEPTVARWVFK